MKVNNLQKTIDGQAILEEINFSLNPQEIVGLVGRNGSGKTTLFRTLAGHYLLDGGEVTIAGMDLAKAVEQKTQLFYIDELDNFLKYYSLKKINEFYRLAYPKFDQDRYLALLKENEFHQRMTYRRLSKGMQGLYQMILAISSEANYLLLDEPFDGLDVIVRKKVIALLLDHLATHENCSIMIASHNLVELEGIIDRVLLLKGKSIVKDYSLEQMREHARKLQLVFRRKGVPAFVKEQAKLLSIQGRVVTVIFEEYTPELADQLKALEPVVMEELPLSLEDLFEANLRQEKMGSQGGKV
ncbi:ABC transporter ATP-binding protein [Enterococcus asini]|uniref:ATP-binding cassette domain-containing protein n=1 Tax=Enterococcus asini TaxID=57732 RepID=UPI0026DAA9C9|nr:ABC transporter ATP-binding protein [Enterococcus asini]MDT2744607.1 ABC transporter ATP-binding protein [Enterococcus asini]MDT2764384.1 ABC transporter ATP-binding protein [Enterococcus asini]